MIFLNISPSEISALPSTPQTSLLRAAARRLRKDPRQLPAFTAGSKHVNGTLPIKYLKRKHTHKNKKGWCKLRTWVSIATAILRPLPFRNLLNHAAFQDLWRLFQTVQFAQRWSEEKSREPLQPPRSNAEFVLPDPRPYWQALSEHVGTCRNQRRRKGCAHSFFMFLMTRCSEFTAFSKRVYRFPSPWPALPSLRVGIGVPIVPASSSYPVPPAIWTMDNNWKRIFYHARASLTCYFSLRIPTLENSGHQKEPTCLGYARLFSTLWLSLITFTASLLR